MTTVRLLCLCALLACLPGAASSQTLASHPEWIDDMRLGGYVIVFRHGATVPQQAPDSMSKSDVPAPRPLNDRGRAQAISIGAALRRLNVPVGHIVTSPVQRAVETAALLGFGEIEVTLDLAESGSAASPEENNRRAQALRRLATARPMPDNNLLIVTHKPNIVDAFGTDWADVREGEASVFEPDGQGGYKLIGRIQADEWGAVRTRTN